MPYSVSDTATFTTIDWTTLSNRPPIDTNHFCNQGNWSKNVPCCMSGYTVEHILESAQENGRLETPEAKFLSEYPCLNGVEMDSFYEKLTGQKAPEQGEFLEPKPCERLLTKFINALRDIVFRTYTN